MAPSACNFPAIHSLISNSLSRDESVRRSAEAALSQLESTPLFCSYLMDIIASKILMCHVNVRLMASKYLTNSINRHWRSRRNSSSMSNDEKVYLRQKLLSHLREKNDQIAETLAVLISKIARFDYPREWPELFSVLAQQLQSADVLTSHRFYMILFRALKELSTKRLMEDQRNLAELSSQLFKVSWSLWQTDVQTILHGFAAMAQSHVSNAGAKHHDELFLTCERWFLCLKIVRQLIISGFQSHAKCIQEIQPVKDVSPVLLNAVQSLLPYYSIFRKSSRFWGFMKKACIKLMKVLVAIQNRHPYSFGDTSVLPNVMEFCLTMITEPEFVLLSFQEFFIQCMVMVKRVIECKEYKNASTTVSCRLTSLLTGERIILLCHILVRRYFVLTPSDLEEWNKNPESFHHEKDKIQWTEKLRPCAEALYILLFENYNQLLGPTVVSILHEAMKSCPPTVTEITPAVLLKDAVYEAAACVYYELSNYLNFRDWFNGALYLELSNDHPNRHIIHRKVALVLGQWVSEIKDDTKRAVYCSLIKLLQHNNPAVKLAASQSLCLHVEDSNFSELYFSDLLPVCWESCFNLVEEVQEFDSKVQALNLISILMGHVSEVIPYADKLVWFFQKVWQESSGESLLQIQLLIAIQKFVVALGYQSPCCYSMLLPVLQKGINVNSLDGIILLEDSMALWQATLSYAPMMEPQLLACFPYMVDIIERSFDYLQVAVSIMESYIILDGEGLLIMHAFSVVRILDLIVENVNDKGLLLILPVIDILIQCFPMEVPPLINSCIQKLVIICFNGGDNRNPLKTAVEASSAAILARILVINTNYLVQLTSQPSPLSVLLQQAGVPITQNILLSLVDIWLVKVDDVSPLQKITFAWALSVILMLRKPQVLDKLDLILNVVTSVILSGNFIDLTEEESKSESGSQGEETLTTKDQRMRQIKQSNPINLMTLEMSVHEYLQICCEIHGEAFNSAINRMHPLALAQVKQALKLP